MILIFSVQPQKQLPNGLFDCLRYIMVVGQQLQQSRRQQQQAAAALLLQQQQIKQQQQQKQKLAAGTSASVPACGKQKSDVELESSSNTSACEPSSGTSDTSSQLPEPIVENVRPSMSDDLAMSSSGTDDDASMTMPNVEGRGIYPVLFC